MQGAGYGFSKAMARPGFLPPGRAVNRSTATARSQKVESKMSVQPKKNRRANRARVTSIVIRLFVRVDVAVCLAVVLGVAAVVPR